MSLRGRDGLGPVASANMGTPQTLVYLYTDILYHLHQHTATYTSIFSHTGIQRGQDPPNPGKPAKPDPGAPKYTPS